MSLPGMKSTADFAAGEIPQNWRTNILLLSPRNDAPLYTLTSMMKTEKTDSPQFNWWEEDVDLLTYTLTSDLAVVAQGATSTLSVVARATRLKPGDMLLVGPTGERVRVLLITNDTTFDVQRGVGTTGTPAGTPAVTTSADRTLVYVGSAYREGAPRSVGTSQNPVQKSNVTQIFRTPVEITRTAMQTTYRTGDPFANDRRRAMNKHMIGIENAFWFGARFETMEQGQPLRYTGGVTSFIDPANIITVGNSGIASVEDLEGWLLQLFAFGSREKLAFGNIKGLMLMNRMVRKSGEYQLHYGDKEYGMNVTRFVTPMGTLVFMEHPLFSATPYLKDDIFVLDTDALVYRPLQDTTFRTDIEVKGVDGKVNEFLTEAGLETHFPKTHGWIRGLKGATTPPA